jgi:hypothetical protein
MEKVAGYAFMRTIIERLRAVPPEKREKRVRQWITADDRATKDMYVAQVMAKLRETEMPIDFATERKRRKQ